MTAQSRQGTELATRSLTSLAAQKRAALSLMLAMPKGSVAELRSKPERTRADLVVASGSSNDHLFALLERFGWMTSRPAGVDAETTADTKLKAYAITVDGRQPIIELLAVYDLERSKVEERMLKLANDICLPFSTTLVSAVRESGGGVDDVSTLLSIAFDGALRTSVRAEYRKEMAGVLLDGMKVRLAL